MNANAAAGGDQPETKNYDFVQLYRKFIADVADLGMANPGALTVFLFLVRHMDRTNALEVSMATIGYFTGFTRQTVSKHLAYLTENGWIQTYKIGRRTIYVINDAIVWTTDNDKHEFCQFNATVVLGGPDKWDIKADPNHKRRTTRAVFPDAIAHMEPPHA